MPRKRTSGIIFSGKMAERIPITIKQKKGHSLMGAGE
jgi:hypothetical protein